MREEENRKSVEVTVKWTTLRCFKATVIGTTSSLENDFSMDLHSEGTEKAREAASRREKRKRTMPAFDIECRRKKKMK